MSYDKKVDSTQLNADLTSVANAIRTKGGTSALLSFPSGMTSAIAAIPTGTTPTGTINITTNGTHNVTQYASANVNVPSGGGGGFTVKIASDASIEFDGNTTVTFYGYLSDGEEALLEEYGEENYPTQGATIGEGVVAIKVIYASLYNVVEVDINKNVSYISNRQFDTSDVLESGTIYFLNNDIEITYFDAYDEP